MSQILGASLYHHKVWAGRLSGVGWCKEKGEIWHPVHSAPHFGKIIFASFADRIFLLLQSWLKQSAGLAATEV